LYAEAEAIKMTALCPTDLTVAILQPLLDAHTTREWIARKYNFKSDNYFLKYCYNLGCKTPKREDAIYGGNSGVRITDYQIIQVANYHEAGKETRDIATLLGLTYMQVYRQILKIDPRRKVKRKKPIGHADAVYKTFATDPYVDTGKIMPPVYKSQMQVIISKELAEIAHKQMGLKPPVCLLADRPASPSARGWDRINNKWVASAEIGVMARLKHASAGRQL
jgi:hypothetical protein